MCVHRMLFVKQDTAYYRKSPSPTGGEIVNGVEFSGLGNFMSHVLSAVERDGALIARTFPEGADMLVQYAEKIASDTVMSYFSCRSIEIHTTNTLQAS
jgi:recyclin-1